MHRPHDRALVMLKCVEALLEVADRLEDRRAISGAEARGTVLPDTAHQSTLRLCAGSSRLHSVDALRWILVRILVGS